MPSESTFQHSWHSPLHPAGLQRREGEGGPAPSPLSSHPSLLGNEENRSEGRAVMWLVGGGSRIPEGLTSAWEECAGGEGRGGAGGGRATARGPGFLVAPPSAPPSQF